MQVTNPVGYEWVLYHRNMQEFAVINMRDVLRCDSFGGYEPIKVYDTISKFGHKYTTRLFKEFGKVWITKEGLVFYRENFNA